jgi:hypothetical protein
MQIMPPLHPMPPRLKDFMLLRNLYLLMIMAESEGVRLNRLQLTIRIQDADVFQFNTGLSKQVVKSTKHYLRNSSC